MSAGIRHTGKLCPHCRKHQQVTLVFPTPKLRQHPTPDGTRCPGSLTEVKS
jgi:hypothetical protein